ncbi:hypothetical protein MMKA1_02000 [Methanococcus maripaludis KA1]|jgi:uncharacterized damage-inducible protein DinB|uniref:Uncharacterized protein n=4 Tax=Methanococcus maripaludis TaxID=39152 RepID=A0A8T3VZP6_METMI|nr:hypothetical protein [Methanococcus maripaludis]BAP60317.1 hypothetical protein MMKA1_02000 [Methanococcus maripaludis KA1]BAP62314.1 hypothetical protein MMOS7_02280 [Methanococcus maripaludis OS7]
MSKKWRGCDYMSDLIDKELLNYLYGLKTREKTFKVDINEVFEEFNVEKKERLMESIETLSLEKMIYIQGNSIEGFKMGISDNDPIFLIITRKGISNIETNEKMSHDKLSELFKY